MNRNTDLEQVLRVHFDNHADPTALDGQLDRITDRLATVRQRPGWTIPERWLPMSAISARIAAAPRLPLRVLAVALLILALAASVLLVTGALRHPVPPPFGPARNGLIAYADARGAINVGDPATGVSREIVAGPGNDRPIFSPDGTRIAFLSLGATGRPSIVVVQPDGSGAITITTDTLASVGHLGWSPDSGSVVVSQGGTELQVFDSTRAGPPTRLPTTDGSDDYNAQAVDLYQPPDGRRVLIVRPASPRPAMVVADRDGSNERVLIDAARSDYSFINLGTPQWSPDGSMITFIGAQRDASEDYLTYVMNADGTGLHPLSRSSRPINESNPQWAPDGKRIAVQRWNIDVNAGTQEVRPITVIDVGTGQEVEVGVVPVHNGFVGWSWSPDGQSILEVPIPPDVTTPEQMIIVDLATRTTRTVPWSVTSGPAWQRVAR
jgi:dipeptidyl aminopeptidase/acylaminoacyl peptidase